MAGGKWRVFFGSKGQTVVVKRKPKGGTDGRLCGGNEVVAMLRFPLGELLLERRAGRHNASPRQPIPTNASVLWIGVVKIHAAGIHTLRTKTPYTGISHRT